MPSLPDSIETLWCWQNQLSTIDTLPASLWTFDASSNNITCFKNIPEDCAIYIQNNSFTCLPNYTNRMLTGYNMSNLLAYPLCVENDTIYNANGCSSIKGIYGFTYIDNNSNCVKEPNESIAKNIPVKLFDSNNNFISSYTTLSSGIYNFELPTDTYLIFVDTANEFFSSTCNNPNLTTVTNDSSSLVSKNFDIECKPGFDIGVQSITRFGWVFPGQQHQLNILAGDLSQWYGLNCADNEGGSIQITINGNVNFDSSIIGTLAPSNIMNNVLTYNVNNFSPSSGILDIGLNLTCDTSSQVGDSISIDVLVLTNGTDNNYSNNSKHYCYPIVNSYDPNNKEVYPPNYLLGTSDWLTYTIHFQNTGTAPAFNIRILDSLNSNLDLSTFEIINYSHANTYTLKDDVINFQFSQIMLVDSATNNELSKGFVQYKIKPKANSEVGTSITNTAYIYFDYNSAIVTNTTLSKIIDLVSSTSEPLSTSKVKIYPNPTSGLIYVDLGGVEHSSITIYNSSGQQVYETVMNETFYSIKIPGAPGIYLMNIQNSQVSLWNKLIKN